MKKYLILIIVVTLSLLVFQVQAQQDTEPLVTGDAPHADRMSVTLNESVPFTVIVSGTENSVFPSAQVAVRNLYTGDTVYTTARFDGTFEALIAGLPNMPYQVNTDTRFDQMTNPESLSGVGVVVHPDPVPPIAQNIPFATGGTLSYGAGRWFADGTINTVNFQQNDNLSLSLDVTFLADDLNPDLDYQVRGHFALRRLFDAEETRLSTAMDSDDNWSSVLTPSYQPILGLTVPDIQLGMIEADDVDLSVESGLLTFSLNFETMLPDDLPAGIYAPIFTGEISVNSSEFVSWNANRIFSVDGTGNDVTSQTILPLLLQLDSESTELVNNGEFLIVVNGVHPHASHELANPQLEYENVSEANPVIELFGLSPSFFVLPLMLENASWGVNDFRDGINSVGDDNPAQLVIRDNRTYIEVDSDSLEDVFANIRDYANPFSITAFIYDRFGNTYQSHHSSEFPLFSVLPPSPINAEYTIQSSVFDGTPLLSRQRLPIVGTFSPLPIAMRVRVSVPSRSYPQSYDVEPNINRFGYYYYRPVIIDFGYYRLTWLRAFANVQAIETGLEINQSVSANGRYGLANQDDSAQAWFDTESYPADDPDALPIVNFPFFSGDVAFLPNNDVTGINPILTGGDYQYVSVNRADTVLDQFVRDGEATFERYVPVRDSLNTNRPNLPNDVLWLFGGVVDGDQTYGYSSVAVITDDASARVVPPFTEPITTDNGQSVDMFVLPTGVRAGQVLEVGDTFAMVGYTAPTVSADVTTTVQTPSETIVNTTQASPFGFFYQHEHDFTVAEAGVYTVYVDATYDGETSAGQLADPIYGTVLGGDNGGYYIFVVDPESPMLTTNRESISAVAPAQPFSIVLSAPADWTDVSTYFLARSPQRILEQGQLDTFSNRATYTFNWGTFIRDIPNLGYSPNAPDAQDDITFSFAMIGTDADGNFQIQARMFTLRANTLYTQ